MEKLIDKMSHGNLVMKVTLFSIGMLSLHVFYISSAMGQVHLTLPFFSYKLQ